MGLAPDEGTARAGRGLELDTAVAAVAGRGHQRPQLRRAHPRQGLEVIHHDHHPIGRPGFLAEPGVYDGVNDFEDAGQAYRVVVPEGYEELAPAPLIIFLAAGGGSLQSSYDWWEPYLGPARSVFVVVEQAGLTHGSTPTLTALIDRLGSEYCIDPRRVHAMGNSSRVSATVTLACEASDRVARSSRGWHTSICARPNARYR